MAYNHTQETLKRLDVLGIEHRGRGPEAKLVTSTIKSLSCGDVRELLGDYALLNYLPFGDLCAEVQILNWRTSSSTRYSKSTFNLQRGQVSFDSLSTSFAESVAGCSTSPT